MESKIICFTCRKRVPEQEVRSGMHDHVDLQERLQQTITTGTAAGPVKN